MSTLPPLPEMHMIFAFIIIMSLVVLWTHVTDTDK